MSAVDEIKEHLQEGRLIVVVGAGLTIAATETTEMSWSGLLRHGLEYVTEFGLPPLPDELSEPLWQMLETNDVDAMLAVATLIEARLNAPGPEWTRWLTKRFGRLTATSRTLLDAILGLGAPLMTTNYDDILRNSEGSTMLDATTWKQPTRWLDTLRGNGTAVMYLHGIWSEPDSVVLGVRSYQKLLTGSAAQSVQQTIAQTHSLMFVGCGSGVSDPNIGALVDWLMEDGATQHRHYILMPNDEVDDFERNVALHPVGFGPSYDFLPGFLNQLAASKAGLVSADRLDSAAVLRPGDTFVESPHYKVPRMVVVPASDGPNSLHPYAIGVYPVTFDEWDTYRASVGGRAVPRDHGWGRGTRPVIDVSWIGVHEYIDWINSLPGVEGTYRLPTELEWMHACSGGLDRTYWWGDDPISPQRANYDESGHNQTTVVGEYAPNPYGLHDMLGNVWEWCADDLDDDSVPAPADAKVIKGGCWYYDRDYINRSSRLGMSPGVRFNSIGFRVARSIREPIEANRPYRLVAACSGLYVTSAEGGQLYQDAEDNALTFVLRAVGDEGDRYSIVSEADGRVVAVDDPHDRNEAKIVLRDEGEVSAPARMWKLEPSGDGYLIRSVGSDKVMDVYASSIETMAPLIQFAEHGNANQRWRLG